MKEFSECALLNPEKFPVFSVEKYIIAISIYLLAIFLSSNVSGQTYQTVTISSGFNYDVVANGTTSNPASTVTTSPYNGLDGVGYVFMSQDFKYHSTTPTYYLPTGGVLNSSTISGLTYQLASYSGNNALELYGNTGTLTFATPVSASQVYILGTTGSGTATASFIVNFSDGTNQTGSAYYPDWFTGPFEVTVGQRFYLTSNTFSSSYPNPGLYRGTIIISSSNCSKLISSISVSESGGGYLAIMAVSIQNAVIPTITGTTPGSECGSGTVSLGAAASSGVINWYTTSTGGTSLATGTSYTTGSISSTTNYYVDATGGGCTTPSRTAITATVKAIPTITSTTPASRCGSGTVSLGATASAGTVNWYTVSTGGTSVATGNTFATPSITSTTTYYADATSSGCTTATRTAVIATVNTIPTISTGSGVAICNGSSTSLTATGGTTYIWVPSAGLSVTTGSSISASPTVTTIYTVTGTNASGCSNTATVTVSVNPLPSISAGSGVAICNGSSASLTASGGITYTWSPSGSLSTSSGSTVSAFPSSTTIYTVTGTSSAGCSNTATKQVTVNAIPTISGGGSIVICSGTVTSLTASGGATYTWTPASGLSGTTGAGVSANPVSTTTYTITGTSNAGCSNTATVSVTVSPLPTIASTTSASRCDAGTLTLSATASAGTINWYNTITGGTALATGPSYTTASLTGSASYYVDATSAGCTSLTRSVVSATIIGIPTITSTTNGSRCGSGSVPLYATASSGTIDWYNSSTGGSVIGTGTLLNTPVLTSSTTYYVSVISSGCTSNLRTAVTATINPIPSLLTHTDSSHVGPGIVTLVTTVASGSRVNWYTVSTGGSFTDTGTNFITPYLYGTTSYWADATDRVTGCTTANRIVVTARIDSVLDIDSTVNGTLCSPGTVNLYAQGTNGYGTVNWYTSATGGSSVHSGNTYTTPFITNNTAYYVDVDYYGYTSVTRKAIYALVVHEADSSMVSEPGYICGSGSTTLFANNQDSDGVVNWYTTASGGVTLFTGSYFTTPVLSATTTYYADYMDSGCVYGRIAVQAIVDSTIPAIISYSNGERCGSGTVSLSATPDDGISLWYTSPTGGSPVYTGNIFTTPALTGTTIYYVGAWDTTCMSLTRVPVTAAIDSFPQITVNAVPDPVCEGSEMNLTATATDGSGTYITYTWNGPSGFAVSGAFVSVARSGMSLSDAGIYSVTVTDDNGCTSSAGTTNTVTVNPLPAISSSAGAIICSGSTASLSASGGLSFTWLPLSGLSATTGAAVSASPVVSTIYTITGTDVNGCNNTAEVTVTVNALPTVSCGGSFTICYGSSTILTSGGAISYSWLPAAGLSGTTGDVITANPVTTTTYTVTGTDVNGCNNNALVTITVNTLPTISSTGIAICSGSTGSLNASGALNYIWLPSTGLSTSIGSVTSFSNSVTTTYTITGTDGNGCVNSGSVTATVNPLPIVDGGSGVVLCSGDSSTLTATGANVYTWLPSPGLSSTTGTSVTVNAINSTTYFVTGTDFNGCTGSASVTVTINPLPVISGSEDVAICAGSSTFISADGAASYSWSPGTGLSATTGSVVVANPGSTTSYTITGTDANGCVNYSTETVTVNALPSISAGSGVAICIGSSTTLNVTGGVAYYWQNPTGLSGATGASVTADPVVSTIYTVTGTDTSGCNNSATVTVTVNALPVISSGTGAVICNGSSTILTATGGLTYSWSPSTSLAAATGASVTASPSSSTTYTVTGTDVNGCNNSATSDVTVNVSPSITSVSNGGAICSGNTLTLTSTATGGTGTLGYSWSGPVSYSSSLQNPSITTAPVTASGVYSLTVTDANSCSASGVTTATVNPTPSAGTITGSSSVCVGNTISVADTATGGIWSAGSGMGTIGRATGIVTGVAIGLVNITYSVTNIYSCNNKAIKSLSVAGVPTYLYTGAGTGANGATGDGGPAYLATLMGPRALCADTAGNVFIADVQSNTIRKIGTNGYISTVAGNGSTGNAGDGGQATAAQLNMSGGGGLYVDKAGNIFISNTTGMTIRKVTASTGIISTICGTTVGGYSGDGGPASAAKVQGPLGICEDTSGNIYFADGGNNRIRRIDAGTGIITTIIGTGSGAYSGDGGLGISARVYIPRDVMADIYGNLYIADYGNNKIRKYVIATGIITTLAGTGTAGNSGDGGPATAALLYYPARLAFDGSNNLYIADQFNNRVRKVNLTTGIISPTIATGTSGFSGDGGPSISGKMTQTAGIAITKNGHIYVSDISNRRIRVSPFNGSIYITLSGSNTVTYGSSVTLTANSSILRSDGTIQWYKNSSAIGSGGNTLTDVPTSSGTTYYCVLTIAPECGSTFYDTSNIITITIPGHKSADTTTETPILENGRTANLYPNPVHESLTLVASELDNGEAIIRVYDALGKVVMEKPVTVTNGQLMEQMNVRNLPNAMYMICVSEAGGKMVRIKFVKD